MQKKELIIISFIVIFLIVCCIIIGICFGYSKHEPNTMSKDEIYSLFDTPVKDNEHSSGLNDSFNDNGTFSGTFNATYGENIENSFISNDYDVSSDNISLDNTSLDNTEITNIYERTKSNPNVKPNPNTKSNPNVKHNKYTEKDNIYNTKHNDNIEHNNNEEHIPPLEELNDRSLSSRIRDYKSDIRLKTPKTHGGKDSKGERLCAEVMNKIFPNTKFYKTRPNWLINPQTGHVLEFDLYTHNLEGQNVRLAVEYQGEQHRNSNHVFNKSVESFDKQIMRDDHKIDFCKGHDIILLIVWDDKNTYKKVWNDIIEQLIIYDICPEDVYYM